MIQFFSLFQILFSNNVSTLLYTIIPKNKGQYWTITDIQMLFLFPYNQVLSLLLHLRPLLSKPKCMHNMHLEICAHVFNLMRIRICSEICRCPFTLFRIYELHFVAIIKLSHVQGIAGCFKRSLIKDCCLVCILKHDYCTLK